jgi:hypothetical protein
MEPKAMSTCPHCKEYSVPPQLANAQRLIAAAKAWREFQYTDSILDQKTDARLRMEAELARQELLAEIDALENV